MHKSAIFSHTEFKSHTLTGAAADYEIPQPSDIGSLGPDNSRVKVHADEMQLSGAPTNVGDIYVELTGVATTASLVLHPGDHQSVSGAGKFTLSALAATAGDKLEVLAFYR